MNPIAAGCCTSSQEGPQDKQAKPKSREDELRELNHGKNPYRVVSTTGWEMIRRSFRVGSQVLIGDNCCCTFEEVIKAEGKIMKAAFTRGEIVIVNNYPFKSFAAITNWKYTGSFLPLVDQPIDEGERRTIKRGLSKEQFDEDLCMKQLSNFSIDSILDGGLVQATCYEIGQEIFDQFKASELDSRAALEATVNFLDKFAGQETDGFLLSLKLAQAWVGIGDENYQW